ncbi:MAG: FAD-dependent oxidoreductase [Rubrobacter sp.]|nr:FAD-dependent oxidoreductase [Rubrobacter sp.]
MNRCEEETLPESARVVVVGDGFAGGSFLRSLPPALRCPSETLLVSREQAYVFTPLIHEVAVGRVHPDSVRTPIAIADVTPYSFLQAEATGVDLQKKMLLTSFTPVKYRYLVLAPGSVVIPPPGRLLEYFQTFWSLSDALRLRDSLNKAWQTALRGEQSPGGLTVVVVGGGTTGVELAAEIAVLFGYLKKRTVRASAIETRVVLLEETNRLMGWLDLYFHEAAMKDLSQLGVEVRLNTSVTAANEEGVEASGEWLPAATRVWVTGVQANPLLQDLPIEHDGMGRARVSKHLTLSDYPEVYVIGDGSVYEHPHLGPLPPTAAVAVQQGPWAARDVGLRVRNVAEQKRRPFNFYDRGHVVSLGPERGIANPLGVKFKGRAAQALYRSILLYYMKRRRERFFTVVDWAMEQTLGRLGFDPSGQQ